MTPGLTIAADSRTTIAAPAAQAWLIAGIWALTALTVNPQDREEDVTGGGSLDALSLAKVVIRFAALAGLGYLLLAHWNDKDRRRAARLLLPLALYWCWSLLSTAWSPLKTVSLGQVLSLLTMCWLSAAIVIVDRGAATTEQLLMHAAGAALGFSLAMLVVVVASGGIDERFGFYLAHPTTVGGTASLGIVLLLAAALIWKWSWAQWLLGPGLLIHGVVLLLAHNRTSLIAIAAVVAVLILVYADRLLLAWGGLLACVALVIAATVDPGWQWLVLALQGSGEFISREQSVDELAAFSGREELWALIWDSFLESPWLGHGYFVTTREGVLSVWGRETNFNAHNVVLQALASTGLIGAAIFLWAIGRPLSFAFRHLSDNADTSRRCGLFVLVFLWLAIWGQCDVAMLGPVTPYVILFFVAFGLLAGAAANTPTSSAQESQSL